MSLTLGVHVQEDYVSCLLSVCVSVKSHLTSGASLCPENTVTYILSGQWRSKYLCFFLKSFVTEIQYSLC